jgi:hypothetical protein
MNQFEAYQMFNALKQHFTSDYDYHKYHGKMNLSPSNFQGRKDKFFFAKLLKHKDPFGLVLSNLIKNSKLWVGELFSEDCQEVYADWNKRQQSLSYSILQETNEMVTNFNDNFVIKEHSHPWLLAQYIRGKVSLELLVILDCLVCFTPQWNKKMAGDPVWNEAYRKMIKYKPFLKYDKEAMRDIFLKRFYEKVEA